MPQHRPDDDPLAPILDCLVDPTRKSARGPYRHAYSEAQMERKIRREAGPPLSCDATADPVGADALTRDQAIELLESCQLSSRQIQVCRLKLDGLSLDEIAAAIGVGTRRISTLLREARAILAARLGQNDELLETPPYYGWQEVFLDSQRRR